MPTLSELGRILTACRVVSAANWQRAAKRGDGDLARTLDALAAQTPEWWSGEADEAPPGLSEYQRSVVELWAEGTETDLARQLAINQFLLLEKLGEGGQGEVYRARQLNPSRFVAVKTLTQPTEKGQRRFEQEARVMMQIQHPSVARFHLYERVRDAAGMPTDEYLIAMEFVDGIDLSRLIHAYGPVSWPFVARWAVDLLEGLSMIHQSGFIHRDIKPANVMILGPLPEPGVSPSETSAKLLDFGAVKPAADETTTAGRKRVFVGTREYAPPEQWEERVVSASDLYALGATLFFALAGRPPYVIEGRDAIAFMKAHTRSPIPDVREFNPQVPDSLNDLLRRMLAKKPDDRGDAEELASEFREFLPADKREKGSTSAAPPPPARTQQTTPTPKPRPAAKPKPEMESTGSHSVVHRILAALERVYLPWPLRPPAGHEPPTPERIAALLRRPLLLITLLIILGLLILWIW